MKRFVLLAIAAMMIICLAACAPAANNQGDNTAAPADQQNTGDTDGEGQEGGSQGAKEPAAAKLTGKINVIDLSDRNASILRGVSISGNQAGTGDGFNAKAASLTDVRCIFELNEWVEFYPDTDAGYYLRVWILEHRDDQEYYNNCTFSDLMPGFANYCDLHYPADEDEPEIYPWGSFYLNKDYCKAGYYDFVFTYEGKAIGVLQTRFYDIGQLTLKTDAELEALMKE